MAIKPVDFQVAIPRTTEASKIGSNDANKNLALQQQAADSVQHKAEDSLRQVYARSKAEDAQIKEKQKENKKNGKKDGNKDEESKRNGEASRKKTFDKDIKTSTIDIKI